MGFIRLMVISASLVALTAIYFRPQFPDTASHHGLKTVTGLGVKLINVVSYVVGLVGMSPINITRAMVSVTLLLDTKSEHVKEYITTLDGVEALVFEPIEQTNHLRPGLIHIHGGGWALMSPSHYAPVLREIVRQTGSVVVSVKYRRAPEVLFPVPVEDCIKASRYFLQHATEYNVDNNQVGIKGDSAGGNMALVVALNLTRDPGMFTLKLMSLDYPALQLFDFSLPSFQKYEYGPCFITKTTMINYWLTYAFGHRDYFEMFYHNEHIGEDLQLSRYKHFVSTNLLPEKITSEKHISENKAKRDAQKITIPNEIISLITNPVYAPLMTSDEELAKLPTSYILNAEFDVLRDEGFILAERLRQNGVEVEHKYWASEEHGFINFIEIDPIAKTEIDEFSEYFNKVVVT